MIPLSLTIQGIYSYQSKQTIDFTKLTAAGLFGIFGPVGSGKSTILEAITFALYGRTDRLNLSGDNRNYNMMNLKSNEMLIEFVFRTGADQGEYMAVVKSRRNSKQFDDVKACERTAYKKADRSWVPVEVETLEKVIGLSYENFKRTIIIPQGRFQEFLLLGSKERTLMMKELFNLERFELYYKVASLESKSSQQKQNIEGQLQQLGEISGEQIPEAEKQVMLIQNEIELKTKELALKQAEESQLTKLKELKVKIDEYQSQLAVMQKQEPEIAVTEKRLYEYEYCLVNFKTLLNSLDAAQNNVERLKTGIEKDEITLREISDKIKQFETDFEKLKKEFETREVLKQKADELTKIIRIADLQDRYQNFLLRIEKGEKLVTETSGKIELLKKKQDAEVVTLKTLKEQCPDTARLSKAKEWYTVNSIMVKSGQELDAEKRVFETEMLELGQQKNSLFNSDCFIGIPISESYEKVILLLEEKQQTHQNAIEVLNMEQQHYQIQLKLEEYATALKNGEPCPLCGSLSHPQKFNTLNLQESLATIKKEISNHEKILVTIDKSLKRLTEINTALCLKEEALRKIEAKQEENLKKVQAHRELFEWDEFSDEESLSEIFQHAEKIRNDIASLEKEIEAIRIQTEKDINQKEMYSKALVELKNNSIQEAAAANTLKEQLVIYQSESFAGIAPEAIEHEKNKFLKQHKIIEEQYQLLSDRLTLLRKDQDMLLGKIGSCRQLLKNEEELLQTVSRHLEDELQKSAFNNQEAVRQILALNIDQEKERNKVNTFRQDLDFVVKQLRMLSDEMKDQVFDTELFQKTQEMVQKLSMELSLKNQEKGQAESRLHKLKVDFEKRVSLMQVFTKLENRLEDIKTLKQLFKGNGFVKYISSVYLRELVNSANDRFYKLSGQKLSLELNEENDFEVRDFLNGGKLRNVKTLSGGQTFQAALSLALALSDNTRRLSGAEENFFFLDEGFGSLDKDSLRIVFDTLKSLRHENRVVGIISHVEEMNQEIDIHLTIKNKEETGSFIEKSWE